MFLQINQDGRVSGSDARNAYSEYLIFDVWTNQSGWFEAWKTEGVPACSRCAAAEISETGSCGHQGAVILLVSLCRQWRPSQGAGTGKKMFYSLCLFLSICFLFFFSCWWISHCLDFQSVYEETDCCFRELLLADGYTRFLSSHHGTPVSLAPRQTPSQNSVPFTRFLPLRNTLVDSISEEPVKNLRNFDMDSDDPFGMGLNTVVSPQLVLEK